MPTYTSTLAIFRRDLENLIWGKSPQKSGTVRSRRGWKLRSVASPHACALVKTSQCELRVMLFKGPYTVMESQLDRSVSCENHFKQIKLSHTQCTENLWIRLVRLQLLSISWENKVTRVSLQNEKRDLFNHNFLCHKFWFQCEAKTVTVVKWIFYKRKLKQFVLSLLENAAKTGRDFKFKYWSFFLTHFYQIFPTSHDPVGFRNKQLPHLLGIFFHNSS